MERSLAGAGRGPRVALVDVGLDALDLWREEVARACALGPDAARRAEVRLVVDADAAGAGWRWAGLAGVARAGEVAALGSTVLDAVVIAAESPRAAAAARLAAALGARVVRLAGDGSHAGREVG